MRKKKLAALAVCMSLTAGILLTGCGSSTETASKTTTETTAATAAPAETAEPTPAATADAEKPTDDEVCGIVKNIDTEKKMVTVSVFDNGGSPAGQPSVDGQTPPEKPSEDGEVPADGQTPPEMPSGDAPSENMLSSDSDKTFNITDSTVITDENGNSISLSELSENAMVMVSADGDSNALTITVNSQGSREQPTDEQSSTPSA